LDEPTSGSLNEIDMIAPNQVRNAAANVFEVCLRVVEHLSRDQHDEVEMAEARFQKLLREFRAMARTDLGIPG
jgi:hypothetical protein